jgi:hypothetical protein
VCNVPTNLPIEGELRSFVSSPDGWQLHASHGVDIDANGRGAGDVRQMYQLIRQHGATAGGQSAIDFLDQAAEEFGFTVG